MEEPVDGARTDDSTHWWRRSAVTGDRLRRPWAMTDLCRALIVLGLATSCATGGGQSSAGSGVIDRARATDTSNATERARVPESWTATERSPGSDRPATTERSSAGDSAGGTDRTSGTSRPEGDPSIDFFNAATFDNKLSSALRGKSPTVTVQFLAPTTLNNIPERVGTWLTMVEKYEGTIRLQDDSKAKTRGLIDPISLVLGAIALYKKVGEHFMYKPVGAYNATIHYQGTASPDSGTVTKVVFTRKD